MHNSHSVLNNDSSASIPELDAESMLMSVSSCVNAISQANDVEMVLESLAKTLIKLYNASIVEILLRSPESSQLFPYLTLSANGHRSQPLPGNITDPISQKTLQRVAMTSLTTYYVNEKEGNEIWHLVGAPIGTIIPEGIIIIGLPGKPSDLKAAQPATSILTDHAASKLLQLRLQIEDTQKNVHLALLNQVSHTVSLHGHSDSNLHDVLSLLHNAFKLLNCSLYIGRPAKLQLSLGGRPIQTGTQSPEGLAAIVYQQQRTLYANNVGQDPRCAIPTWVGKQARSELALPIHRGQQCRGVLDLFSPSPNAFNTQDIQTLTTLVNQIATLIEEDHGEPLRHPEVASIRQERISHKRVTRNKEATSLEAISSVIKAALKAQAARLYRVYNGKLYALENQDVDTDSSVDEQQFRNLAMESLERHQPVWVGPVMNLPDSLLDLPGERSTQKINTNGWLLAVPGGNAGEESCVLMLRYPENEVVSPALVDVSGGVAALTGLVLQTTEDTQNHLRQKQWLALMFEIAVDLRKLSSPKEVALKTTHKIKEGMGWACVELYRWDEVAGGLVLYNRPEQSALVVPVGENFVGMAARDRRIQIHTPEDNQQHHTFSLCGEIAIPLMIKEQLRGVLYVRSYPEQLITREEQQILSTVAELLADTLDSVDVYIRLRRQLQEATTLYHITRSLNNADNLEFALDEVVSVIRNAIGAHHARISLLDENGTQLITRATAGEDTDEISERYDLKPGITNLNPLYAVATKGQPIYVADMHRTGNGIFMRSSTRSLLAVPLISSKGDIIGTLSVSSKEPDAFSRVDEHLLNVAGGQVAIVIENIQLYQDLEERRKHLRLAYVKLRELTELKDQILQNVSHEIRTPLTLIKGYVELIREDGIGGDLTPTQRQAVDTISRRADDVVRIVGQIVALQPLNDLTTERAKVSVKRILQEVVDVFQLMISGTNLSIHLHPVNPELYFNGDYEKIRQLCYNILDNSVKFSPGGGHITVQAVPEEAYIHLTFTDQGIGIDERQLSRIFDTFYQIDGSSTRQFGGLGLGLAVVNRVVESHQGKVWVESELHKGSIFHVLLPQYVDQEDKGTTT